MGSLLQHTIFGRTKNSFVSIWRTSNISAGSSTSTQIKLPLLSSGSYNFTVDWEMAQVIVLLPGINPRQLILVLLKKIIQLK